MNGVLVELVGVGGLLVLGDEVEDAGELAGETALVVVVRMPLASGAAAQPAARAGPPCSR